MVALRSESNRGYVCHTRFLTHIAILPEHLLHLYANYTIFAVELKRIDCYIYH